MGQVLAGDPLGLCVRHSIALGSLGKLAKDSGHLRGLTGIFARSLGPCTGGASSNTRRVHGRARLADHVSQGIVVLKGVGDIGATFIQDVPRDLGCMPQSC